MKIKILLVIAVFNLMNVSIFARNKNSSQPENFAAGFRHKKLGGGRADCKISFDNSTGWNVKVYISGNYRGTVGAWDNATIYYNRGLQTIYVRADFVDGTFRYWGPLRLDCSGHTPVFKIVP